MIKKLEMDNSNETSIKMVQYIINYIEENIFEELTPNIIAIKFYLSIATMNSVFKIVCNMTIMEYVRNRKDEDPMYVLW